MHDLIEVISSADRPPEIVFSAARAAFEVREPRTDKLRCVMEYESPASSPRWGLPVRRPVHGTGWSGDEILILVYSARSARRSWLGGLLVRAPQHARCFIRQPSGVITMGRAGRELTPLLISHGPMQLGLRWGDEGSEHVATTEWIVI